MSFGDAIKTCLSKYVDFSGRARRSEYWFFFLFNVICSAVAGIFDGIIGGYVLRVLVALALMLPMLSAGVRRLHDTNRTGWLILIGLIPIVGWILVIVWYATEGTRGPNQYGPDPKAAAYPAA